MSKTIIDCVCWEIPIVSSLSLEPGAAVKDIIDEDGRWHGVVVERDGETKVYRNILVDPSQSWLAKQPPPDLEAEARAIAVEKRVERLTELRQKRKDGKKLTNEEVLEALDLLLEMKTGI